MKNQKPLSEYQKRRLGAVISALQSPTFSTQAHNVPGVQLFINTPCANPAKTLPQNQRDIKKSVETYLSKVNIFIDYYGKHKRQRDQRL